MSDDRPDWYVGMLKLANGKCWTCGKPSVEGSSSCTDPWCLMTWDERRESDPDRYAQAANAVLSIKDPQ